MKSLIKITLILTLTLFTAISTALAQRTIEITGTDNMKFDVTSIEAQTGEEITIKFTTKSQIPKTAMAHNVVVLDKDANVDEVVMASMQARDNEYIAPEYKDQIVAATALAGGGETVEVTFTVPQEPGQYEYVCTFPGHYQAGMKGVLTVTSQASK
ncbi:plastocyanin/azurin family copper-binding protein [Aliifodinibius sp. S!AR15-10]|uniref:plastocyanin/azurin family copper-binding protein n=1 Tax=Aliifodinibius sp. S!AR15-10 TaxID=2950437 RepID=UPI00285BFC54|nr:plastocyanin/azurin family copper-binding protein [Aliifodinibius sp. S!AR15-10]MDR8390760.1 plastocyanin/azurin family copper-binding protein [Aliifodinibius sp. S!AR15-10]